MQFLPQPYQLLYVFTTIAIETDRAELSKAFEPYHHGKTPWVVHSSSLRSPKPEQPHVQEELRVK